MADNMIQLDRFLPYRLSVTANAVSEKIAKAYETLFGLTVTQWRVIAWVAELDNVSQQQICERTRMDKVSVSRAAIALADRGLLNRISNPLDRRSHMLSLSPKGLDVYHAIAPKALELESRIFSRFDHRQLSQFTDMLQKIEMAANSLEF